MTYIYEDSYNRSCGCHPNYVDANIEVETLEELAAAIAKWELESRHRYDSENSYVALPLTEEETDHLCTLLPFARDKANEKKVAKEKLEQEQRRLQALKEAQWRIKYAQDEIAKLEGK